MCCDGSWVQCVLEVDDALDAGGGVSAMHVDAFCFYHGWLHLQAEVS